MSSIGRSGIDPKDTERVLLLPNVSIKIFDCVYMNTYTMYEHTMLTETDG